MSKKLDIYKQQQANRIKFNTICMASIFLIFAFVLFTVTILINNINQTHATIYFLWGLLFLIISIIIFMIILMNEDLILNYFIYEE